MTEAEELYQYMNLCDSELLVVTKGSGVWGTRPEHKWSVFDAQQTIGYGSTLKEAYDQYHLRKEAKR
jgi:hypothetical protein